MMIMIIIQPLIVMNHVTVHLLQLYQLAGNLGGGGGGGGGLPAGIVYVDVHSSTSITSFIVNWQAFNLLE